MSSGELCGHCEHMLLSQNLAFLDVTRGQPLVPILARTMSRDGGRFQIDAVPQHGTPIQLPILRVEFVCRVIQQSDDHAHTRYEPQRQWKENEQDGQIHGVPVSHDNATEPDHRIETSEYQTGKNHGSRHKATRQFSHG